MRGHRRGLVGLNALIILIGILIAAATTVSVLMQTSQSLMRKDQAVQEQKSRDMQKPILVDGVRARDNTGDKAIDELFIVFRIHESSEPVRLNDTIIVVYSELTNCTTLTYTGEKEPECRYHVNYIKRGKFYSNDYATLGDLVEVSYNGSWIRGGVGQAGCHLIIMPSHGVATRVNFIIPERLLTPNVPLWPLRL
jgi:archaellin